MGRDHEVRLRDVTAEDIEVFYRQQLDPEATEMAAFPPRDHGSHTKHWTRILANESAVIKTIEFEGRVAGNLVSWINDGTREIGYWIGRELWGRGIATAAVQTFVELIPERPLFAWVASHNAASIRVLRKCGFTDAPDQPVVEPGQTRYVVLRLES